MASDHSTSDSAGVRYPPPLVYIAGFGIGLALNWIKPAAIVSPQLRMPIAAIMFAGWLLVAIPAIALFARTSVSLNPSKPVGQLVTSGIYRFTRNPMYVALALLYLGAAFLANSLWVLLLLIPVLVFVRIAIIRKEEQYLERRFGDDYLAYKRKVPRWL